MRKKDILEKIAEELGNSYEMYFREKYMNDSKKLDGEFIVYMEGKIRGLKVSAHLLNIDMNKLNFRAWEHFGRFADDDLKQKMHEIQHLEKTVKL